MIGATASGIQVATLCVAVLAVGASFAGPYFVARFSTKTERKVWQRDQRVKIYSNYAAAGDEFSDLLQNHPTQIGQERLDALNVLYRKLSDVRTFGSLDVKKAAFKHFKECAMVFKDALLDQTGRDVDTALGEFRDAVRKSLKIDDD